MVVLTELLPESSSSCLSTLKHNHNHNHAYRYDVFLSFRGVDTRNGFTDHLYNALLDASVITFLDDEEIETGEPLKPELDSAIRSSRASIIVLSENYASSSWCLDELVLILEQKKNFNQIVIPIFYHVEPTDVRKQQNSFGKAMANHKQKMETETDEEKRCRFGQKMNSWKIALTQVADLKGKNAKGRKETEFIKEVVANIHRRLGVLLSSTLPPLVGMNCEIEFISSWLTDGCGYNADILTIIGIDGIGKTSLAKYVFQLHSSKFHKSSFIEGINARCNERFNGLLDLQKQLHGDISTRNELRVNDFFVYTSMIEKALAREKVFVILDDIGSLDQLDAFLVNKGLHPGSKVIITTTDASLTEKCALFNPQVQHRHKKVSLNGLDEFESLQLLCIYAFKSNKPKEGYKEVSKQIVKYCEGHPLALKVLGRSLHKQDVPYWEHYIKRLMKEEPHSCIKTALKTTIDSLPFESIKDLFKHIACFFVGMDRDVTKTILNACDVNSKCGIAILIDRCLLSIGWNNELVMHQLVKEMGRDLVRQESPHKPWKRSRLWCHEDLFKVLKQKKGKENLLGLALDMRMLDKKMLHGSFELKTESFIHMDNLKLLQLNYVQLNGCFKNFPEELIWLCMHGSHLKSIPLDLPMENLVALDMSYSNIETFDMSCNPQPPKKRRKGLIGLSSKDMKMLESLKILNLSFCEQLHNIGGFFLLPALKRLIAINCTSLIEVCESIEQCDELIYVDLSYCYNLRNLPKVICKLNKVKTLRLDGYNSCEHQTEAIPNDFKLIAFSLPSSLITLSLANNNLSSECFPMDFSCLTMLEELCLDYNPIISMPDCVRTLPKLEILQMDYCEMLISVENPPCTLREFSVYTFRSSEVVQKNSLRKIKFDPKMSPLKLGLVHVLFSSIEIDGMVKIQGMTSVEEKVLHGLGWTNLNFIKESHLRVNKDFLDGSDDTVECQTQMYYEFGIFSTIYEGKEMPDWIGCRNKGSSISFTIPSSPKKLRGLNFCCVETYPYEIFELPMIKVSNITKNHTWIYKHYTLYVKLGEKGCLSILSHWMFESNEMNGGDHITITVEHTRSIRFKARKVTKECGISLVYDEDGKNEEEEEEDVLGYYKSWNHIIGGDLSSFQLTTGEYILDNKQFTRFEPETYSDYQTFIGDDGCFKEETVAFKAFSQKMGGLPSHVFNKDFE